MRCRCTILAYPQPGISQHLGVKADLFAREVCFRPPIDYNARRRSLIENAPRAGNRICLVLPIRKDFGVVAVSRRLHRLLCVHLCQVWLVRNARSLIAASAVVIVVGTLLVRGTTSRILVVQPMYFRLDIDRIETLPCALVDLGAGAA